MKNQLEVASTYLELKYQQKNTQLEQLWEVFRQDNVNWSIQVQLCSTREQLLRLERARDRVEDGTYGACQSCNAPINPDRLIQIPEAELCINCVVRSANNEIRTYRLSPACP